MSNITPVYKSVSTITGYKTSDSKIFEHKVDADKWQHKVNRTEEICMYFKSKLWKFEELNPDKEIQDREVVNQVFEAIFSNLDLFDAACFLERTREKYDTNIS